jgi:hypothetical protein
MHQILILTADACLTVDLPAITYTDFLTITLTALCVILATLGFIVAALAVIGYRDIKKAAKKAAESAIIAKLKEYPDAAEMQAKFAAGNQLFTDMLRQQELLSKVRSLPPTSPRATKIRVDTTVKRPSRYPPKGE